MSTRIRAMARSMVIAGAVCFGGVQARAQGPTIDTSSLGSPGSGVSPFGRTPGAGGSGGAPQSESLLGGRAGPTTPKGISTAISNPGMGFGSRLFAQQGVAPTANNPAASIPVSGPLGLPPTEEDPGPPDGLTLDQAIDRLIKDNLDLQSKFYEIPQSKADTLTASLRSNPVFYADAQLVPYGQYTRSRPGGQTQYDVNISYPLDVSRKRQARTASALRAEKVTEAQYQDAVRQTIDNLYSAYVDVLQARRTIAFAEAALKGLAGAYRATEDLVKKGEKKPSDLAKIRIQRTQAEQQLLESQEAYRKAKQALAAQLNIAPSEADAIELRGTLKYQGYAPPSLEEMIQIALTNRPDVVAYRLGVERARSDVKLQYANRFQDVYVLAQPYTLQDNTPFGLKSPTSWALGVTIPMPLYNRNQGNIQRSKLNVRQTQVELSSVERLAILDVQRAEREFFAAKVAVERIETSVLPDALMILKEAEKLFPGEIPIIEYLAALKEYNDNARTYLDGQVRLRRAMLDINTAVGQRILP
jgi:cobalt-zinc-cadmium efflux system outer membrane protein